MQMILFIEQVLYKMSTTTISYAAIINLTRYNEDFVLLFSSSYMIVYWPGNLRT